MVKRFFDNRKVWFVELISATDNEPFFTQFFGQRGYGRENNALGENCCRLWGNVYLPNKE